MKGRGTALAAAVAAIAPGVVYGTPAAGGDAVTAARTKTVTVDDDFFRSKRVTISRGDRVRWVWRGTGDHNVRFRKVPRRVSRRPGSRTVDRGSFSRRFRKRGRYTYVCTIHEDLGMTGSVRVR